MVLRTYPKLSPHSQNGRMTNWKWNILYPENFWPKRIFLVKEKWVGPWGKTKERLHLILCFCEGKGAGSSGGSMGSVRLETQSLQTKWRRHHCDGIQNFVWQIYFKVIKFEGIAFLRDLPDLRDPVSESVSGVPTEPGVNNFYCSFKKIGLSINAF